MPDRDHEIESIIDRLNQVRLELTELHLRAPLPRWTIWVWILSGTLGLGGIVLAPFSGGASLLLSVLGFAVFLADMAKQIRVNATTSAARERAEELLSRLASELALLRTIASGEGRPEKDEPPPDDIVA